MIRGLVATTFAAWFALGGGTGWAVASGPSISVSSGTVKAGDTVVVTLTGWSDVTTVAVCGNDGERGAVDCDQVSSVGVPSSPAKPTQQLLHVTVPPSPCPCVVRASTAGGSTVKAVPIVVVGAPTAPVQGAPVVGAPTVAVSARVVPWGQSLFDRLRSTLAGPTRRTLIVRLENVGPAPVAGLSVTVAVGRNTQEGEPLQPPNVDLLQPGEARTYRMNVSLGAPSFGSYDVFGTVYGAGAPVSFTESTGTKPWGLFIVVVVFIGDVVAMAYLRLKRRLQANAWRDADGKATSRQTEIEQTWRSLQGSGTADMVGRDALADA